MCVARANCAARLCIRSRRVALLRSKHAGGSNGRSIQHQQLRFVYKERARIALQLCITDSVRHNIMYTYIYSITRWLLFFLLPALSARVSVAAAVCKAARAYWDVGALVALGEARCVLSTRQLRAQSGPVCCVRRREVY